MSISRGPTASSSAAWSSKAAKCWAACWRANTRVPADIVVPVPDSGVPAAVGYSQESGIPFRMGLIRNHYVGRTFIEPQQSIRDFGVKLKLNPVPELLRGKRVVLVDDSIVRGTTSRKIVRMVREAGAAEVHMRISCPPTISPCYYGVDTPTREELIASDESRVRPRLTPEELEAFEGRLDPRRAPIGPGAALDRRNSPVSGRGYAGLRFACEFAARGGRYARLVLHVVLHGRVSGGRLAGRA